PRTALQREAMESFLDLGFPTSRDEDWKFTNLAPLTRTTFNGAVPADTALALKILEQYPAADIVFVDGKRLRGTGSADLHLAQYADYRKQAFIALNTAFSSDAAYVRVPTGTVLDKPIHVVHVCLTRQVVHPRNLFVFEAGSQGSVIETYVGDGM